MLLHQILSEPFDGCPRAGTKLLLGEGGIELGPFALVESGTDDRQGGGSRDDGGAIIAGDAE